MDKKKLTAENGRPIADNQNIQTAGKRGPVTLQDPWFLEKLAHFDREVIPERRMHAKGSGAFGTFTVMHDITKYTRASIFAEVGKQTPCFVRFSTVAGERGAADAERVGDLQIFGAVLTGEIAEQLLAQTHHRQQSATGAVILRVRLQVFGQLADPAAEQRDLHFRRTGVAFLAGKLVDDLSSLCLVHRFNPFAVCVFGSRSVPDKEAVTA